MVLLQLLFFINNTDNITIMAQGLPVFPSFSVHEPGVDNRWRKWTNRFENLMLGMDIKDKKRQRALFLHYAGEEVNDIFETLTSTGDDYETAKTKLTEYFAPKKNTEYEIYKFRQSHQENDETLDSFHTRLRQLSRNCEFSDIDREIKSQIIQGCKSSRLRRKALREDLSLDSLIKEARAQELSDFHAAEIENKPKYDNLKPKYDNLNAVKYKHKPKQTEQKARSYQPSQKTKCRYCGYDYPHKSGTCPATGKTCAFCKKKNHFEAVCLSKRRSKKSVTYKMTMTTPKVKAKVAIQVTVKMKYLDFQ